MPVFLNKDLGSLYHEVPAWWVYSTPDFTVGALLQGALSNTSALSVVAASSIVSSEYTFTYNSSTREAAKIL